MTTGRVPDGAGRAASLVSARRAAVRALRHLYFKRSFGLLGKGLADREQVVREAALGLSRLQVDGGEAVAALLTHDLADLRIAGAVALGESQNPRWVDRLESLRNDQDGGVRKSARLAIERLAASGD